ncbi:MAG: glycosyltransferase family 39 protein [Acidimicrobiales bacterium]|nr:glycosyltransferase family 39 protein [Acidimicrobiales bacterium]
MAAGQLAAGVGNLGFALVAARLLDPAGFAHLSVFLSLYLVLSLPATSLSAATAIAPGRRNAMLRTVARVSVAGAAVICVVSPWLAGALKLPVAMVLGLALALPATSPLALDRGRLYGTRRYERLVASLLAEPIVRLSFGLALAAGTGEVGAAAGVVAAAYAAREVVRPVTSKVRRSASRRSGDEAHRPPGAGWTAGAFALVAVVQTQDLVFANSILPPARAGAYAVLSTLGGTAAFATVTIPLVLLPRAVGRVRRSLAVATGLAAVMGLAAVGVAALAPRLLVATVFGARYTSMSTYVVPYLIAMALLGVARVLAAHRCATGSPRRTALLIGGTAVAQAIAISVWGRTVGTIAATTVASTAALVAVLGIDEGLSQAHLATRALAKIRAVLTTRTARIVGAFTATGLLVRFIVLRGIWLDEATSIHEAGMPFSAMLSNLRTTDVHPPLYFSILWLSVRVFGHGPLAVRIPSILAGAAIVPVAYLAAQDAWDRRSGLIAAALASVAPILVWYSQEARMYSLFMLLALLAVWGQVRVLRFGRPGDWAIWALSSAGLVWTEYFSMFQVIAQQAVFVGVLVSRKDGRRRLAVGLLAATAVIVACTAPLLPFAWHQFVVNQNAGKGFGAPSQVGLTGAQAISVYTVLANMAWALIGYHSAAMMAAIVALWPAGILLALFLLGRNMTDRTIAVAATAVIPAMLLLGVGTFKRNLFDIRYMSGVIVALLLLMARLVTGSTRSFRIQAVTSAVLVVLLTASLGDEQVNGSNPRLFDFAAAFHAVDAQYQPGDLLAYAPGDLGLVASYYAPRVRSVSLGSSPPKVAAGQKLFVLASQTLMGPGQPAQVGHDLAELRNRSREVDIIKKANVTVWVFEA